MILLKGAEVSIRKEDNKYIAFVYIGFTHTEAVSTDPAKAIGLAVMKQAGFTQSSLLAALTNPPGDAGQQD